MSSFDAIHFLGDFPEIVGHPLEVSISQGWETGQDDALAPSSSMTGDTYLS